MTVGILESPLVLENVFQFVKKSDSFKNGGRIQT